MYFNVNIRTVILHAYGLTQITGYGPPLLPAVYPENTPVAPLT